MFKLGIVGGRLQGLEAAYLAKAAGYHVTLFDRRNRVPAMGLSDQYFRADVSVPSNELVKQVATLDALLPAVEDEQVLADLENIGRRADVPVLHDARAYALSSSKRKSNEFLKNIEIPMPPKYPDCPFPVIVKPSSASGSHGVRIVHNVETLTEVSAELSAAFGEVVVEAYQSGPSLSMEVIGNGDAAVVFQATELAFDERFDCKRVFAPHRLSESLNPPFSRMCERIGQKLRLEGIMDVEVIVDLPSGSFRVLEIDARLPSQTPIAVYHSTGVNLVERMVDVKVFGRSPTMPSAEPRCAILEHMAVEGDRLAFIGETRLIPWGRPVLKKGDDFFGADAAITDYVPGKHSFKATLITHGKDWSDVGCKRDGVLARMTKELRLRHLSDPEPDNP